MAEVKTLYERDFVAWSKEQADALRAAGRTGSNQLLDWENLAEEIEGLGISQRTALRSQIRRIIRHLIKLTYSPAIDPRRQWVESIIDARAEIEDLLETSPSLKADLSRDIAGQTERAIDLAIHDLRSFGEIDNVKADALRQTHYTEEQVLGDWFPEERRG
jgi:hypothetical protein